MGFTLGTFSTLTTTVLPFMGTMTFEAAHPPKEIGFLLLVVARTVVILVTSGPYPVTCPAGVKVVVLHIVRFVNCLMQPYTNAYTYIYLFYIYSEIYI